MHKLLAITIVPLAGACAATMATSGDSACSAAGLERFAGQPASQTVGTEILGESGATILRWIPEGAAVTLEFRDNRVNVRLDGQNRIEGVTCG